MENSLQCLKETFYFGNSACITKLCHYFSVIKIEMKKVIENNLFTLFLKCCLILILRI